LKPVAAPEELAVRLGFARPKQRQFPRMAVAIAAAVVMMAGGLAANREARYGETVEFASADRGAISVWLGHSGTAMQGVGQRQGDCSVCHSM
jgi:hypothetical protein